MTPAPIQRLALPMYAPALGSYSAIYERMRALVHDISFENGGERIHPLRHLNTGAHHDIGVALLAGWALVADALSFYNERISQEGYLPCAADPSSLEWLAREVGYRPFPGAAASAYLALTLAASRNGPTEVTVPYGPALTVQSVPAQGELPAVFEGAEEIEARLEWNELLPFIDYQPVPQTLLPGAVEVVLDGAVTSLRAGSPLLILAESPGTPPQPASHFRIASAVKLDRQAGNTTVSWTTPLAIAPEAPPQRVTQLYTFRRSSGLFGRRAPGWTTLNDATRARHGEQAGGLLSAAGPSAPLQSLTRNLPQQPIRALAASPTGALFAATAAGLYRLPSLDPAAAWTLLPALPARQDAQSLYIDSRGYLYLGSVRGGIAFSTDDGASWQSLRAPLSLPESAKGDDPWWKRLLRFFHLLGPAPTPAPQAAAELDGVVSAIAEAETHHSRYLFIATSQGVFRMQEGDLAWKPFSHGLPGYNATTGLAGVATHALTVSPFSSERLFAATAQGVYESPLDEPNWKPHKLDQANPSMPVLSLAAAGGALLAGTSEGVFRGQRNGEWLPARQGMPADCSVNSLSAPPGSALLVAATSAGVFISTDAANHWTPLATRLVPFFAVCDVFSPALSQSEFPATLGAILKRQGLQFASPPAVSPWTVPDSWQLTFPATPPLPSLVVVKNDAQILVSRLLPVPPTAFAAAAISSNTIFAAAPLGDFLSPDWPGFSIEDTNVDLDRVIDGIDPGSLIAIDQDAPQAVSAHYMVLSAEVAPRAAFERQATITRIAVRPDASLGLFDLREATVYSQSLPLEPFVPRVPRFTTVSGADLTLQGDHSAMQHGRRLSVQGKPASLFFPSVGGLRRFTPDAATLSLPGEDLTALAVIGPTIYAGSALGSVFRFAEPNAAWEDIGAGLPAAPVSAFALSATTLHAAVGSAVCRFDGKGWLPVAAGLPGSELLALAVARDGILIASDGAAAFTLAVGANAWQPASDGLSGAPIRQLACAPQGEVVAATSRGVLRFDATSSRWMPLSQGEPELDVHSIAFDAAGTLYAGTAGDVFRWTPGTVAWESMNLNEPRLRVTALAAALDDKLYAGTRGGGVLEWSPGAGWLFLPPSASNDVRSLALDPAGALLAACGSTLYLAPAAGSLVPILQTPYFALPESMASALDQRILSPALASAFAAQGTTLTASAAITVHARSSLWSIRNGDDLYLVRARTTRLDVLRASLLSIAIRAESPGAIQWTLAGPTGATGTLHALPGEATLGNALAAAASTGEFAQVATVAYSPALRATTAHLAGSLRGVYDPFTVRIAGNVVLATQGETIPLEVLGSGDTAKPNQRFTLRRAPLTYLMSGSGGIESTLSVSVDSGASPALTLPSLNEPPRHAGQRWNETHTLFRQPPGAHVYTVSGTPSGSASVTFGDGLHGSRLPTGAENVSATYRVGVGASGNVAAESLTVFRKRPAGLRSATNPAPAVGGLNPESHESLRISIPESLDPLDRIVSLPDYASFASAFPGIAQVVVTPLLAGSDPVIHITAAAAGGVPIDQAPPLADVLHNAIAGRRAGREQIVVAGYSAIWFCLTLRLSACDGFDAGEVAANVRAALARRYSPQCQAIGQNVIASEIVALVQPLEGVRGVRVEALHRRCFSPSLTDMLRAQPAHWDPVTTSLIPAELILLGPPGELEIILEAAS